jgi:hypothetical protein
MYVRYVHGPLAGQTEDVADRTYAEVLCQTGYAVPATEPAGPAAEVGVPSPPEPVPPATDDASAQGDTDADADMQGGAVRGGPDSVP